MLEMAQAYQQGITSSGIDYFDVMVIGKTGQGKSTATDKLLVASLSGKRCRFEPKDFSLWCMNEREDEDERLITRFKNLSGYSNFTSAHEEINSFHASDMLIASSTRECEVFSNEKTKIRVLDVPGFNDKSSITTTSLMSAPGDVLSKNLLTMRRILQIQTAKNMYFQRILYFLPSRGPLERVDASLQVELRLLVHYFGLSFLKSLVIVVTVRKRYSESSSMSDEHLFNEEERKQTLRVFSETLRHAFPDKSQTVNEIKPPIILLRLSDTCEDVLRKVQDTQVVNDRLKLQLNPNTCGKCGVQIGTVQGEKVVCYHQQGPIPYSESTCHPVFEPVYPLKERVKQVVSFGIYKPLFEEVCAYCGKNADSQPCMKVNEEFSCKNKPPIIVDHENTVKLPETVKRDDNELEPAVSDPPDGPTLQVGLGYQGGAIAVAQATDIITHTFQASNSNDLRLSPRKPTIIVDLENTVKLLEIASQPKLAKGEGDQYTLEYSASKPLDGPALQAGLGYQGDATANAQQTETEIDKHTVEASNASSLKFSSRIDSVLYI